MRRPVLLSLVAAAALVAGCGGEEDGDAEGEVTALIEVTAITTNPAACTSYFTLKFVEQVTKVPGPRAIEACEASAGDGQPARSVAVSEIEVDGNRGSVVATYEGGSMDGQAVSYAAVRRDGGWRLDEITGFPVFDRESWLRASARASYERSSTPTERQETDCAMKRLRSLDDAALQELVLDPSPEPLIEIARACEVVSDSA